MRSDWLRVIRRPLYTAIASLNWMAGGVLVIIILMILANTVARYIFRRPLFGIIDLIETGLVIIALFAAAQTEVQRAHISVSVVVDRFPQRARLILVSLMYFLGAGYFVVLGWRGGVLATNSLLPITLRTGNLGIPISISMFLLALGALMLGLTMLLHCFQPLPPEEIKKEEGG